MQTEFEPPTLYERLAESAERLDANHPFMNEDKLSVFRVYSVLSKHVSKVFLDMMAEDGWVIRKIENIYRMCIPYYIIRQRVLRGNLMPEISVETGNKISYCGVEVHENGETLYMEIQDIIDKYNIPGQFTPYSSLHFDEYVNIPSISDWLSKNYNIPISTNTGAERYPSYDWVDTATYYETNSRAIRIYNELNDVVIKTVDYSIPDVCESSDINILLEGEA